MSTFCLSPSPSWGGDDRGAVRGGGLAGRLSIDPDVPTRLACGELSLPMKGRDEAPFEGPAG
jgi:hypothetical protein